MKNNTENIKNSNVIFNIIVSIVLAFLITFIIFAIMAVVLVNTDFPEKLLPAFVIVSVILSILISSIIMARINKKNGLINGTFVGIGYMLTLYILTCLLTGSFAISQYTIFIAISAIISGAIGGIIGVNLHR